MSSYSEFAYVYDIFMDSTPYEEWKNDICVILKEYGINDGLVLDLGCGTGTMTRLLQKEGYDMIGVDASFDMLNVARDIQASYEVQEEMTNDILYLCQDMREFELYGTIRAVVSVCDCINYLTEPEDVVKTFKLVNNYLDPQGLFIFDFNTVHKYRDVIGDTTIAENRENCSFIWENSYDDSTKLNQYDLTIFVREDLANATSEYEYYEDFEDVEEAENDIANQDNEYDNEADNEDDNIDELLFVRHTEQHIQRGYELAEMKEMLERAGMEYVRAYDTDTKGAVTDLTERITVVAREKQVAGKVYK